jgi:hypothetical protein
MVNDRRTWDRDAPPGPHRFCGGYYEDHTCQEVDSLLDRLEQLEAQVAAVRELCGAPVTPPIYDFDGKNLQTVRREDILRALDGGGA